MIWAYTENWLVLILGSLPPLRSLFVRIFHQISTTASRSHTARNNQGYNQYYSNSNVDGHVKSNNINMYPIAKKNVSTDDDSAKNILPGDQIGLSNDPYGTGILRTTEIQQVVRGREGSDDSLGGLERPVV